MKTGYKEKRDKNGRIEYFRIGDKKHYIEFNRNGTRTFMGAKIRGEINKKLSTKTS